ELVEAEIGGAGSQSRAKRGHSEHAKDLFASLHCSRSDSDSRSGPTRMPAEILRQSPRSHLQLFSLRQLAAPPARPRAMTLRLLRSRPRLSDAHGDDPGNPEE